MDDELPARPRRWLQIAWPSFLMAGVQEALVFAVVDPRTLDAFGLRSIDWPVQAVYTVSFFIFWGVIALACAASLALAAGGPDGGGREGT